MPEKETAGPSTALRSGRDDNSVMAYKCFATELLSRPEEPSASGPPKVMKNGCCSAPLSMEASPSPLSSRPGFPATQHWTKPRVRLSVKERRMRSPNATKLHRKSGGAQPRDLQFYSWYRCCCH